MNIELFTICDFAQDNFGKLTVLGAFDTISVRDFPSNQKLICVAARIRFPIYELGSHKITIEIINADNERLIPPMDGTMTVNGIGGDSACTNIALTMNNLHLDHEDSYKAILKIDDIEKISIPLYVRQIQTIKQK